MAVRNINRELSYMGSPVQVVISITTAADELAQQRTRTARAPINTEWKYGASQQALLMQKERKIIVHQTMFPLLVMNILENHATKDHPLTITEITDSLTGNLPV